jgi:hypothetical protein
MSDRVPPEIDMRADGTFRLPPQPPRPPILTRIFIWAAVIAVIAGALFRFQLWRARSSVSGQRDVWRR